MTKRWRPLAPLLLLLFLAPAGARADQTVNVGPGIAFAPSTVSVAPGETVTWVWAAASLPHSTTSDSPSGPETWDSGVQTTGSFSHTFQTPGSYPFHCSVHSFAGGTMMNGVVNVSAAATPTLTTLPTPTSTPAVPAGTPTITATAGPGNPAAIPDLSWPGRIALALALAGAALLLLRFARPS